MSEEFRRITEEKMENLEKKKTEEEVNVQTEEVSAESAETTSETTAGATETAVQASGEAAETVVEASTEAVQATEETEGKTAGKKARKEKAHKEETEKKEKEPFKVRLKEGAKQLFVYFGIFAAVIIVWEVILRFQISGGITKANLFFLFFVPAQAMVLAAFNGLFPKKANRILFPVSMLLIAVFYGIQLVYYRIFGSLLSVYLLGMGTDAVGNFWWAMKETLIKSMGYIALLICPVIAVLVLCLTKKIKCNFYPILLHVFALLLGVGLWFGASQGIILGGDGRSSAYYAFHSDLSDTDTTASRVGTMTTTLVEAGSYYLGIAGDKTMSTLTSVDMDSITLEPEPVSEKVIEKRQEEKVEASETPETSEVVAEVEEIEKIPYVYEDFDFEELAQNTEDATLRDMYEYFGSRTPTTTNEYTGLFEGYNLIYICGESYWNYAIDERVTPTLYKMSKRGIILNNYYNSFRNTTTNGEYAFNTSLWPDVSRQADSGLDVGSFPQSSTKFMPNGLGDFFATEDVPSYAFHNYYGNYYRRRFSWPNLGYQNLFFMNDGMKFTSNWPASDAEMMQQSVEKYIDEDRFFVYYMTFSGHGPYNANNYMYRKNIEEVKKRLGDDAANYNTEALGFLAGNLELEYGMNYLLDELRKAGKLENTLIVLTGDHYPYYLSESGRNSLSGKKLDEMDIYKSSCIMYTEGLKEPIVSDTYCCNVDIVPTVLNLFGIKFDSRLFMGTDIFSDGVHKAVLYNKSFITDKVVYNATSGDIHWKVDPDVYDWKSLDNYVEGMSALVDSEYTASINIIKTNFFLHLWQDSGLLTEEEVEAERQRASKVQGEMQVINVQEQKQREEYAARKAAEEAAAAMAAQGLTPDGQPIEGAEQPAPAPEPQPEPVPQPQPEQQPAP